MSTTVVPPSDDDDDKARLVIGKNVVVALLDMLRIPPPLDLVDKIIGGSTEKARAAAENIMNKSKKE
jgi:hypothetical protein